ncbi:hypothetical protein IFM89_023379 [Coptis chinensis]|uniref:Phosphorylated adapter RNA export protein n=1 Tax=Coptis chinensis TaxID=261450 RepID=A0A835LWX9_9MAGN|nr:hypothetical protein IFM89_023379 [Coptis chinensis]
MMMEGSENILEIIGEEVEEEELEDDDVDMIDVVVEESIEEGEIEDEKQQLIINNNNITEQEDNNLSNKEMGPTEINNNKKKKNRKRRNKKKQKPLSTITDVNRFVLETCRKLKEKKSYLIWNAVGCLGVGAVSDLVQEVYAIQACGGQMTVDGKRARNGGGILWNILKTREPRAYKEIMTKGKELEKQFRKQNFRQGPTQDKDVHYSERIAHAPSDQIEDQASDGSQIQDEGRPSSDNGRVSALSRIRVPVDYADLLGEEVKD